MGLIQYRRAEGGFEVLLNGVPQGRWRIKNYLGLNDVYTGGQTAIKSGPGFIRTQIEYKGQNMTKRFT